MRDYWIPMILFGVLTAADSSVPIDWYPAAYLAKAVIVTTALILCRAPHKEIVFEGRHLVPSMLVGLAVFVVWIGIDVVIDYPRLGTRSAFDADSLRGGSWWPVFVVVRMYGLVVMVPIMEEIFWRSFLLRYLTDHDFTRLQLGTFSALALSVMVAASAIAHPEWPVAIVASLAFAFWLKRTRSLFAAIVAHATANAALGSFVLAARQWQYW
jgi:CAAX prenyl protease-like protein